MRCSRAAGLAWGAWLLAGLVGCGSDGGSGVEPRGASSGSGGSLDLGNGQSGGSSQGRGGSGSGNDCASQRIDAERLPLDLYLMVDVSGSMMQQTEGDAGITKWQAITSALRDFVSDPASSGLGVGMQVFPLTHPDAPKTCSRSAECAGFGECDAKLCWSFAGNDGPCESDLDCGNNPGDCVTYGLCENDPTYVCRNPGGDCGTDTDTGKALGACLPQVPACTGANDCRAIDYATPAVPIGELPAARAALLSAIDGRKPDRNGLTPTGPALAGALSHSKTWAETHPTHRVVTVLATDGAPTLKAVQQVCQPLEVQGDLDAIARLAETARAGSPSISTFVIGVLGPDEEAAATVLQSIATAGGSGKAFIVSTREDVQAQFREALDAIRGGLSCELAVPQGEAGAKVEYTAVNVDFTGTSGQVEKLSAVDRAEECGDLRAWYYDVDPSQGTPTRILACPALCSDFRSTEQGSVEIALGCETRKVPK